MAQEFTANEYVGTASDLAGEKVASAFSQAQGNTAQALTQAYDALQNLGNTVARLRTIDTYPEVEWDFEGDEVISNITGDIPEPPEEPTPITAQLPEKITLKDFPDFSLPVTEIGNLVTECIEKYTMLLASGSTGIDPAVEQAIYARAVARKDLENLRLYTEAEQYFSARGFTLPAGAMAGRLQEINIEISRKTSDLNVDVMIKQADLEQTNLQYLLKEGVSSIVSTLEVGYKAIADYNAGLIQKYQAEVDRFKTELMRWSAESEAYIKTYITSVEAYKVLTDAQIKEISLEVDIAKLEVEKANMIAEIALKNAAIDIEYQYKIFALGIESMKSVGQISAQIAAGAMASVNASASVGFSGGASVNSSDSQSIGFDGSKSVVYGATTSYTHIFDETAAT